MKKKSDPRVLRWSAALLILVAASPAFAAVRKSDAWVRSHFDAAERMRSALGKKPEADRTRAAYQRVMTAYRKVYYGAPGCSKAPESVEAVAELLAESGRQFDSEKTLHAAIGQYEFLRREYPASSLRFQALLTIGTIYQEDLHDQKHAKETFEEFLRRYPHHSLAADARQALNSTSHPVQAEVPEPHDSAAQADDATPAAAEESNAGLSLVTGVRYWSTPDYTRVAIDLERDVKFESQRIHDPDRVYFDLVGARLASSLSGKSYDVQDGLLKQIRVAQFQSDRARVVLDLDDVSDYDTFFLTDPARLVIDVHGKVAAKSDAPAPETSKSGNAPKKVIVEADDDDEAGNAEKPQIERASQSTRVAVRGRHKTSALADVREARPTASGERSLIRALGLKIGKIVIDPGHGGHDTGTIGPKGLLEKDLVLDVSKRLGKLLQNRLGAEVTFTRDDDTFIPLETRTSIANQEQADLFVSVHANSSRDPDARGVETYYLNFTTSPEALEVAARENAVSQNSIHELQDLVKKIALKEKIEESQEFAADVQEALHGGLAARNPAIRDRGVKKAPFIVLIGANMPSILAEISFVSNPSDERRLRTAEYRQRIAESLYRGISRYVSGLSGVKVARSMEKNAAQ